MSIRYAGAEERSKRLKRDMSRIFDVPALTRRLPLADQPARIAVDMPMFAHQRRALGRMQAVEQNLVQQDIRLPGLHCDIRTRGGVLCDKVGFGKTLTVLALISSSGSRRNLVLTPDHLIDQWESELRRCTPGLRYTVFSDKTLPSQLLAGMMSAQEGSWRCLYDGDHDLVFMTLSCFASALPLQQQWGRVFLDECHDVVLLSSDTTDRMAKLKSPIFWCITGTPFPKADDSVYGINKVLNIKVRFRLSDSPFTKSGDELHENHPFEVLKRALYIRNPVLSSAERRAMGLIGSSIEVLPLRFTAVERAFYDEEERRVTAMNPYAGAMHGLRMLCCHPCCSDRWQLRLAGGGGGDGDGEAAYSDYGHGLPEDDMHLSLDEARQRMISAKEAEMKAAESAIRTEQSNVRVGLNTLALLKTSGHMRALDWQATNQSLRIPAYDTSIKARLQNGENQQFKHNTAAAAQCVLAALTLSQGSRLLVDTMDWLRSRAERMAARETDLAAAVKDVQFFTDIEEHLGLAVVSEVATVAMVPAADTAADTAAAADPAPVATGAVAVELAAAVAASASVQQRLVSCLICLEEVSKLGMLPCGHHGCEACIRHWVAQEKTCPTCRRALRGLADISYIDANKTSAVESSSSSSGGREGGKVAGAATAAQDDAVRQFGSKPAAVLEYVARTLAASPDNRVLIFSKFERSLVFMDSAFQQQRVGTARCATDRDSSTNMRAVAQFTNGTANAIGELDTTATDNDEPQSNDAASSSSSSRGRGGPCRVLLLPCEHAGTGTNLQCTTHIVFLEPPGDNVQHTLALETQCIGRADRIGGGGRTTPVSVHYFILEDTVEEKIYTGLEVARRARVQLLATSRLHGSGADARGGVSGGGGGDRSGGGSSRVDLLASPPHPGNAPPSAVAKGEDEYGSGGGRGRAKRARLSEREMEEVGEGGDGGDTAVLDLTQASPSPSSGPSPLHQGQSQGRSQDQSSGSGRVGPRRAPPPPADVNENACPCCGKTFKRNDSNLDVNRHIDKCLMGMLS